MTTQRFDTKLHGRKSVLRAGLLIIALALGATPAWSQGAQPKVSDLPGLYESINVDRVGEWTDYALTLTLDGEAQAYEVRYAVNSISAIRATIETSRVLLVNGTRQSRSRVVITGYKRDKDEIKNLERQLLADKETEGWSRVAVKKLEVTGSEDVVVGGKTFACLKIEFEYSGTIEDKAVEASEVIHYCDKVQVTKMAKFLGNYVITKTDGVKKSKLELTMLKSGKADSGG